MTDQSASSAAPSEGRKFLFLWLQPGVTGLNLAVFFYAAFATIGLLTFVSPGTALVLNANFGIPINEQGTITGDLVIVTEIVQLLLAATFVSPKKSGAWLMVAAPGTAVIVPPLQLDATFAGDATIIPEGRLSVKRTL